MRTESASQLHQRGLAFLAGAGFAAVPTVGPYVALLAIVTGRLQIQRLDRWWWLAAAALGLPWMLGGYVWDGIGATAQVLAVWLIVRAAAEVRRSSLGTSLSFDVGAGLVFGFAVAMALGLSRASEWRLESARSVLDVFAWTGNPALFGHAMVVLAALLAVVIPSAALRATALALGALAALVSGSVEAVLAWLIVAVGLRFLARGEGGRGPALVEWGLVAVMLVAASGLGDALGLGRPGFRLDLVAPNPGANLFRGTEATGEWWYPLGVEVAATTATIEGIERSAFIVTKRDPASFSRLQQIVELRPQRSYVLSVAWRADAEGQVGLDGWARSPDGGRDANLAATHRSGSWLTNTTQHFTILAAGVDAIDGDWLRGHVVFRYEGDTRLVWYVGAVPDRSAAVGTSATFAEFQLVEGDALTAYLPNASDVRFTDLRASRLPMWREALGAIAQRPWLGWGPLGFPRATTELAPSEASFRPLAAHAHSLVIDTWLERGLLGLVGLVLLAGVMALRTLQQRDRAMALVLGAVVVLNLFETTFFNGAVIYPLAAVLGWRAVGAREIAQAQTGVGSAGAVRVALAATDVLVAFAAISVATLLTTSDARITTLLEVWSHPALPYLTLLWPALSWLIGLYPGYGLAPHEQLARSVRAAAAATVALGFLALLLGDGIPLNAASVLLVGIVSVLLAPVARFAVRRFLSYARLWGRPVVVLGTGPRAAGIVRYLLDHRGVGLHPVAAFGDDGWDLPALPVTGRLDQAWSHLETLGVRHAIVTPEAAVSVGYDEVLRRAERSLQFVQFVPELHGVPAASVIATPLGTTLALQVRNQLASTGNRAVKRTLDVAGAAALLAVLGLPLLAVALWIRLDSRGPALYLSPRLGRYGETFRCVKFRTMHVDADARLERLLASDPALREEYERFHKLERDPRVTRAGRVLRALSIDEFTQLLNVLAGQMSLVGPRPYMVRELEQMGDERDIILLSRPGMTGYWQVDGRNDVTFDERQAMEATYVRNWSVWWDVEILLRTPAAVLDRTGK